LSATTTTEAVDVAPRQAGVGRLMAVVATAFALESALYSTLAALLPHYEREFDLSTFASGILAGCYSGGMVVGILVAGLVWCSLLNWLIAMMPAASRGAALGAAMGAGVFGMAAGPLLGAATKPLGTFAVFAAVAIFVCFCIQRRSVRVLHAYSDVIRPMLR
jgi:MFS family permease